LTIVCGSLLFATQTTHAATLYFSPASGSYAVGKIFTVNVMVASTDQAANAYSGTITYPTDKLVLTAIGKGGSIVSIWVQNASFSGGRANFEGITLNPGYKGDGGRIVSLTFRAKAAGTAAVRFSAGSVLANDGEGTDILTGMGSAAFTIIVPEAKPIIPPTPPPAPVEAVQIPAIPLITQAPPFDIWAWTLSFVLRNRCTLMIPLLLLILIILLCKYLLLKMKMENNAREAQEALALQAALGPLMENVQDQINTLEKAKAERELTIEENVSLEKLKQNLVNTENHIRERIETIGKQ